MLCPKCGFNSFEYNTNCPKCRKDLRSVRKQLSITATKPGAVNFFSLLGPADEMLNQTIRPSALPDNQRSGL
ncbi:MAG: hypothetical protein LBP22_12265 [Deltaproteobacteria bacterium]|nr:hypothetical protein [Deltaproteobacteria bacterium]